MQLFNHFEIYHKIADFKLVLVPNHIMSVYYTLPETRLDTQFKLTSLLSH